jgi:hypothetical protein
VSICPSDEGGRLACQARACSSICLLVFRVMQQQWWRHTWMRMLLVSAGLLAAECLRRQSAGPTLLLIQRMDLPLHRQGQGAGAHIHLVTASSTTQLLLGSQEHLQVSGSCSSTQPHVGTPAHDHSTQANRTPAGALPGHCLPAGLLHTAVACGMHTLQASNQCRMTSRLTATLPPAARRYARQHTLPQVRAPSHRPA